MMRWFYCFVWGGLAVLGLSLATMVMSASLFSEEKCELTESDTVATAEENDSIADLPIGKWSVRRSMDADGTYVFDKAMKDLMGVQYTPVFYAFCKGENFVQYCFLCEARIVIPNPPAGISAVYVVANQDGSTRIKDIKRIDLELEPEGDLLPEASATP